ncbi:MAG: 30S ribosomal protein S21 [Chitinophagales bacterium]|jgi:small subunit ribosomal protein S21|nr:30S ribosomal protein S21 [Chitinophagales bacterium]
MLIIDTRDSDSIDKALKKYKKKFDQTGVIKKLRSKQAFIKKSIVERNRILKAKHREAYLRNLEN